MKLETTRRSIGTANHDNRTKTTLSVLFVLFALQLAPTQAEAQTQSEFQIWTAAFVTAQLRHEAPSPLIWFDAHARRGDAGTVLILRPGIGYAFTPWGSVWLGYVWQPFFTDLNGERVDAQGVWEQITFNHQTSRLTLQSRTRLEQLWSDVGSGMFARLRQFGRFNYRPSETVPLGLALWDEVFFGLNNGGWGEAGFRENRIFAGLAIFANKNLRVEPGYMFVNVNRASDTLLSHVFAVNLIVPFKHE